MKKYHVYFIERWFDTIITVIKINNNNYLILLGVKIKKRITSSMVRDILKNRMLGKHVMFLPLGKIICEYETTS